MRLRFQGLEIGSSEYLHRDVLITGWESAQLEYRDSDQPRPGRDGFTPGRDYLGRKTRAFTISSDQDTMASARRVLREFLAAWRHRDVRLEPGRMVPLEFMPLDTHEWTRIYGRPRVASEYDFGVLMRQGVGSVDLEFEQLEPRVFDGGEAGEHEVIVRAVASVSGVGLRAPLRAPLRTGDSVPESSTAVLQVSGSEPTPPVVEFHGPGRGFRLDGNQGWHLGLHPDVVLAGDESITIDPLEGRVRDNFGRPRFGALDMRTAFRAVELAPATTETVYFSAQDATGTAHAVIRWRDAWISD